METQSAAVTEPLSSPQSQSVDRLISMQDVAKRLSVSYPKIKAMATRGELPSVKIGRRRLIAESTLQTYIQDLIRRANATRGERSDGRSAFGK